MLALTAENARHLDRVSAPLLVLHGTLDTRSEPAHSEELVRRAASTDKTLRLVEGAHHQLFQARGAGGRARAKRGRRLPGRRCRPAPLRLPTTALAGERA